MSLNAEIPALAHSCYCNRACDERLPMNIYIFLH